MQNHDHNENHNKHGKWKVNLSLELYQCLECGLHYRDEATANQCEAWCKEHKSCNLEITKSATERQGKGVEGE